MFSLFSDSLFRQFNLQIYIKITIFVNFSQPKRRMQAFIRNSFEASGRLNIKSAVKICRESQKT
ncbi:hypothetical protein HMPREF9120_01023 [Neisseria sp. oral taxon 020 str. F0370]|nr:hypothetical protein HMPREF9120_01023 [Neisseria sp. oral taxon 020 str. F0370]